MPPVSRPAVRGAHKHSGSFHAVVLFLVFVYALFAPSLQAVCSEFGGSLSFRQWAIYTDMLTRRFIT